MLQNVKAKKIVFLFPTNAIKSGVLLDSIFENKNFYNNYNLTFCFDSENGKNLDFVKKNNFDYIVVQKDYKNLENITYDILISCGWGWKIPNFIIDKSTLASLNCHSSLLPDYKGGSVYRYYWANCEKYTGATVHFLTEKFDAGNILTQEKILISKKDTSTEILIKVSHLTSVLIRESILKVESGEKGYTQTTGRYFFRTSRYKLRLHRLINCLYDFLGISKKWMTPYKDESDLK